MSTRETDQQATAATALVAGLVAHGATHAFGVPGESYLAVLDALYDVQDTLPFITCRHEAAAANMAEAHGKLTGRPGICFVTRGPGATHASIGVHTAYQDSTPMILFIGQVARHMRGKEAFQEMDYHAFFGSTAKWVVEVDDAADMSSVVAKAYHTAISGRPGPVVVSLPEDMLVDACTDTVTAPYSADIAAPSDSEIVSLGGMLDRAARPLIMAGGSGWSKRAVAELEAFSAENNIPVCVSFRCQDRFDNTHPNYVGDMGIGANPKLIKRMQEADLLLVLGPRLGEMTTDGYTRLTSEMTAKTMVHVHQGAEELGRVYEAALSINASPVTMMAALKAMSIAKSDAWAEYAAAARADYTVWNTPLEMAGDVQLGAIYDYLNDTLGEDAVLTNGAGNYAGWLHRFYRYTTFPSQLAPTCGAMGYGVPAAIAAKITNPNREVVCFAGDGCFMMSSNELATAVQYDANVIFLVFNNSILGTIRMHQERDYPERVSGTELKNPDFVAYAESFGAFAARVTNTDEFAVAFEAARGANKPAVIEIMVETDVLSPTTTISALRGK